MLACSCPFTFLILSYKAYFGQASLSQYCLARHGLPTDLPSSSAGSFFSVAVTLPSSQGPVSYTHLTLPTKRIV